MSEIKIVYRDGDALYVRYVSGNRLLLKGNEIKNFKINNPTIRIGKTREVEPEKDEVIWE